LFWDLKIAGCNLAAYQFNSDDPAELKRFQFQFRQKTVVEAH
jgi:hypothetical protein